MVRKWQRYPSIDRKERISRDPFVVWSPLVVRSGGSASTKLFETIPFALNIPLFSIFFSLSKNRGKRRPRAWKPLGAFSTQRGFYNASGPSWPSSWEAPPVSTSSFPGAQRTNRTINATQPFSALKFGEAEAAEQDLSNFPALLDLFALLPFVLPTCIFLKHFFFFSLDSFGSNGCCSR